MPKPKSGAAGDLPITSDAKHFKALGFLLGVSKKKKSEGNNDDSSDSESEQESKKKCKKRKQGKIEKPSDKPALPGHNQDLNKSNEVTPMDIRTEAEWKYLQSLLPYIQDIADADNKFLFRLEAMYQLYKLKTASQKKVKSSPRMTPSSSTCASAAASTSTPTLHTSVPSTLPKIRPSASGSATASTSGYAKTFTSASTCDDPVPSKVASRNEKKDSKKVMVDGLYYCLIFC